MGSRSEAILDKSLRAVWTRDAALAAAVQDDDIEIDRLDVEIDEAVLKALALQAPVAEDLREVMSVKMIATDLERVGDLARNIANSARRLSAQPPIDYPPNLSQLARVSQRILRRALDALGNGDVAMAHSVLADDDDIDLIQDEVIERTLRVIELKPEVASQNVDVILLAKHLERVADHATNIAEDVILALEARNVKHAQKLSR